MEVNRFPYQTDLGELERRWKVTLEAMAKENIDALLLHSFDRKVPCAALYLTDIQIDGYPFSHLFGKEGISMFGTGGGTAVPVCAAVKNVAHNIGVPVTPVSNNCRYRVPEQIAKIIKKYAYKRLGVPSYFHIPTDVYLYLKENTDVEFVNFSEQMDHIMAIKSPWEIEMYKQIVELHDIVWAATPAFLRVGRTEREVAKDIRNLAEELGANEYSVILGADKTLPRLNHYLYAYNTINEGDVMQLLIEFGACGGLWAEVGRQVVFGEPTDEQYKVFEDAVKMQDWMASKIVPGVKVSELYKEMNEKLKSMGYHPEKRFNCHGQGTGVVMRPMLIEEETMEYAENMFIAIHPNITNVTNTANAYVCDCYLVGPSTGAVKLSRAPSEILKINHIRKFPKG